MDARRPAAPGSIPGAETAGRGAAAEGEFSPAARPLNHCSKTARRLGLALPEKGPAGGIPRREQKETAPARYFFGIAKPSSFKNQESLT